MVSELGGLGLNENEIQQQADASEVSQEDVIKVEEDVKKAAQVWAQIQDTQSSNKKIAKLLKILISDIEDNLLISYVYNCISKYGVSIQDIFLFFIPFFQDKIKENGLESIFEDFLGIKKITSVVNYSDFVQSILEKRPIFMQIDRQDFLNLIKQTIYCFEIGGVMNILDSEKSFQEYDKKLEESLINEFYK